MSGPVGDIDDDIDAAAAAWDARLRGARTALRDHAAFQAWLEQDAAHGQVYDRLQAGLRLLCANADLPELSALRDEARDVVRAGQRRRAASVVSVGAGLAALFLFVIVMPWTNGGAVRPGSPATEQIYATAPGERTPITLGDGSIVTLDAGTRLAVRLAPDRRDIALLSGRALFKVAKDSRRPFVVQAGGRAITALGTVFDVRVSPRELRVTLAEGVVAVGAVGAGQTRRPQILKPRQQLIAVAGGAPPTLRTVDLDTALAWADRQLFFDDEPLASAVDEMNRYTAVKMVVDPEVAGLRINGMFRVSDQAGFIAALQSALPVDIRSDSRGRLIVSPRAPGPGPTV